MYTQMMRSQANCVNRSIQEFSQNFKLGGILLRYIGGSVTDLPKCFYSSSFSPFFLLFFSFCQQYSGNEGIDTISKQNRCKRRFHIFWGLIDRFTTNGDQEHNECTVRYTKFGFKRGMDQYISPLPECINDGRYWKIIANLLRPSKACWSTSSPWLPGYCGERLPDTPGWCWHRKVDALPRSWRAFESHVVFRKDHLSSCDRAETYSENDNIHCKGWMEMRDNPIGKRVRRGVGLVLGANPPPQFL